MDPQRLTGCAAVWVVLVVFEAVHGVLMENTLLSEAISSDGVSNGNSVLTSLIAV